MEKQIQKAQHQYSANLTESLMKLTENNLVLLNEISINLSIEKSLNNGVRLNVLNKQIGIVNSKKIIALALYSLSVYLNLKNEFKLEQCYEVAGMLMNDYYNETVEDILLCIKNIKTSKYGVLYNRLDGQIIFDCFKKYLDEKYAVLEEQQRKIKASYMENISISEESKKLCKVFTEKIKEDLQNISHKNKTKTSLHGLALLSKSLKNKS